MDYVLAIVMALLVAGLSYNTYRNIKRDGIGKNTNHKIHCER
jgi:hypothetical protein